MNSDWASGTADPPAAANSPFEQLDFLKRAVAAAESHLRSTCTS